MAPLCLFAESGIVSKLRLIGFLLFATGLWAHEAGLLTQLLNVRLVGEIPGKPRPFNNLPSAAEIAPTAALSSSPTTATAAIPPRFQSL